MYRPFWRASSCRLVLAAAAAGCHRSAVLSASLPRPRNMSAQRKISSYFNTLGAVTLNGCAKTTALTRKSDGETVARLSTASKSSDGQENESGDSKRARLSNGDSPVTDKCDASHNGAPSLTPEQEARMNERRLAAKLTLVEKSTGSMVTNFGASWLPAVESEFKKEYFVELCRFVNEERARHTVYPPAASVFSWTVACRLEEVKVVIIGQDPYHGPNQAHGLCFSVQAGVPPPPSLESIFKELATDIQDFKDPDHGNLTGWAQQGVLLLNAVLTVRAREANSHKDRGWEKFTDAVISWLNSNKARLVFILWGSYAQKKGSFIDKKKHLVLSGVHPSPLSAYRGFFGCKHFSRTNDYLRQHGKSPIDWTRLPRS